MNLDERAKQPCVWCGKNTVGSFCGFYSRCDSCGFVWGFGKECTLYWERGGIWCTKVLSGVLLVPSEEEIE